MLFVDDSEFELEEVKQSARKCAALNAAHYLSS